MSIEQGSGDNFGEEQQADQPVETDEERERREKVEESTDAQCRAINFWANVVRATEREEREKEQNNTGGQEVSGQFADQITSLDEETARKAAEIGGLLGQDTPIVYFDDDGQEQTLQPETRAQGETPYDSSIKAKQDVIEGKLARVYGMKKDADHWRGIGDKHKANQAEKILQEWYKELGEDMEELRQKEGKRDSYLHETGVIR